MRFKILLWVLLLFSCTKKESFADVKILGHAATGLDILNSAYHDNSREAVEYALAIEGSDGVEIDIQLSKDGKLWLYHDNQLESETNGSGCINNLNASELATFHYKTFAKEELVPLSDLDFSLFKGKELFLDLRHLNSCENSFVNLNEVMTELVELNLVGQNVFTVNCILSYQNWIQPLSNLGMNVYYSIYSINEMEGIINDFPDLKGFIVRNNDFSKSDIDEIKDNNKKVYIFEMRSPKGIRKALRKLPDGVITDDLRATIIEKY